MKPLYYILLTTSLFFWGSCSSDEEEIRPTIDKDTIHTSVLRLDGGIQHFDDEATATRAVTSEWEDGAKLFIQYQTSNGLVDGTATYSESTGEWTVNYYGNITHGQTTKCEVYYFENATATAMTSVSLNHQSAVYSDSQASYIFEDGIVILTAHLKPMTGRIRFRGTAGYQFSFTGLKWYSGYDITANSLSQQSGSLTITVGQDGYTPYVYASFADATERKLTVDSGEKDYVFVKNFDNAVLATGKSGNIRIPTTDSRYGWQLVINPEKNITITGNGKTVSFKMLLVEGGTFMMGATSEQGSDAYDNETPVHQVTLTKIFFIGETEVTQGLWYAIMGQKPTSSGSAWSSSRGLGDNYPAYYVSWDDCQQFIAKLNQMTGLNFRLPTEAEWEFAARGGTKSQGYKYSGSNNLSTVGWYGENSGDSAHPVKTKSPNELGIYDMSGNVWEWCQDRFGSYSSSSQTDPIGSGSGSDRVICGGGWGYGARGCRVSRRDDYSPAGRSSSIGFRLVL